MFFKWKALTTCEWPGRNQIIESSNKMIKYYIEKVKKNKKNKHNKNNTSSFVSEDEEDDVDNKENEERINTNISDGEVL